MFIFPLSVIIANLLFYRDEERTLSQQTFVFMYLCFVPDYDRIEQPKHVEKKPVNEFTDFESFVFLDLNRY